MKNIKQPQLNIEKLKEGLTYQGKQRIDILIKDIRKSIKTAECENIKAMRYHLQSLNGNNNDITGLFMQGLGISTKTLFDLNYFEHEKKNGMMMIKCKCKWLKDFLTVYRSKYETKSYEV